ncbi:MAG: sulfur transferase domain-containing protein [Hyphomicrobiaceae bacterium]
MSEITYITPQVAVSGALGKQDFEALRHAGFRAVISNRPNGEEAGQLDAREEAELASRAGLEFRHVPAAKHAVFELEVIQAMSDALDSVDGPVLLHCKTGIRSALMWAAASVRTEPLDCVMNALARAGFPLEDLREDIARHVGATPGVVHRPALACDGGVAAIAA